MDIQLLNSGSISVCIVSGRLDIEKSKQFKQVVTRSLKNTKIIFSLERLNFVGSSGIQLFFQAINELRTQNNVDCRIVGLNNDFKRLLEYSQMGHLDIYENMQMAIQSFV